MMYEWKQTIFKPKDFEGSGQYIVKETTIKERTPMVERSGYLSTVMFKIGYIKEAIPKKHTCCLIYMSDGLIMTGYYSNTRTKEGEPIHDVSKWIRNDFSGEYADEAKEKLCEYLNNNPYGDTYRFATNEEVVRVIMHQRDYRTKN